MMLRCNGSSRLDIARIYPQMPEGTGRMILRPLLSLLLVVGLSGCWTGQALFTPAEGLAAIPDGTYRVVERGSDTPNVDRIRVVRQPDGSFIAYGPVLPWHAIIVPLDSDQPDRFVVQLDELKGHPAGSLFVLLDRTGGALHVMVLPCGSFTSKAMQGRTSPTRDPNVRQSCVISDKATLLNGLRHYIQSGQAAFNVDLVPVR